jgi:hypothetical protein
MAQTTVKIGNHYLTTIKSHGKTIAKASSTDRQQARQLCLQQYQQNQGIQVL